MTEKRVTLEEVLAARTPRGGWTKKQLAEWGVDWPPTIGWIKRLTGDENAKVPMPGRTPVAMYLARKTRLELEQEVERLRAGGCARDQGTTQYCAEAAKLAAENERLRAALEDILSYVPHGDLPLNLYDKARAALDYRKMEGRT